MELAQSRFERGDQHFQEVLKKTARNFQHHQRIPSPEGKRWSVGSKKDKKDKKGKSKRKSDTEPSESEDSEDSSDED